MQYYYIFLCHLLRLYFFVIYIFCSFYEIMYFSIFDSVIEQLYIK